MTTKRAFFARSSGTGARGRRAVLAGLLGGVGTAWAARPASPARAARAAGAATVPGETLGDPAAMAAVGALYLRQHPGESDRAALFRAVAGDGPGELAHALVRGIARDWRAQDVVVISGWVFARTEGRLCALVHLDSLAR